MQYKRTSKLQKDETKLHVLIIGQYFPPDLGGAATRVYNVAKGLIMNGCDVTVVTAFPHYPHGKIPKEYKWKPLKVEQMNGVKVLRTFVPPLESRGFSRRILLFFSFIVSSMFALSFVGKIDVIWAANPDLISMMPAILYSKLKKTPIASNLDDLLLEDLYDLKMLKKGSILSRISELFARIIYRKADVITPISPGYVEFISRKYPLEKHKLHLVRGGVDTTIFIQSVFQKTSDIFTVLYSGAFSVAYDFDQILKAAKILEAQNISVKFILQGKGELSQDMLSMIKELNLKSIQLIDKVITRKEVSILLGQADVLILPLKDFGKPYLGISSKLYEYQASGKPIICCADGQPSEYVKETNTGIVIRPGDYEALATAIIYLKENSDVAKTMGENGRAYIENNLSIDVIGLEMKKIFENITQDCSPSSIP